MANLRDSLTVHLIQCQVKVGHKAQLGFVGLPIHVIVRIHSLHGITRKGQGHEGALNAGSKGTDIINGERVFHWNYIESIWNIAPERIGNTNFFNCISKNPVAIWGPVGIVVEVGNVVVH